MSELPQPRCAWATNEPERSYHDAEWGVPMRDDRALFELLTLESAQAGLSWRTILLKREGYRAAFAGFDATAVARFDTVKIDALVRDARIVRHRGKIESTVGNAKAVLAISAGEGSFSRYLWRFVDNVPIVSRSAADSAATDTAELSRRISRDLKARGFRFVGPTIVYAFLQASGIVNDHAATCFRRREISPDLPRL